MQWINTLILCCWSAHPLTYYCIIKRLRSEAGHAKAGSSHMKPRNGGSWKKEIRKKGESLTFWNKSWLTLSAPRNSGRRNTSTNVWTKGIFLLVTCRILWREARAGTAGGWVGEEGGGPVSADADSLDVELAQECLTNDLQSDSGGQVLRDKWGGVCRRKGDEKRKSSSRTREQSAADHGFGLPRSTMHPRQIGRYCLKFCFSSR